MARAYVSGEFYTEEKCLANSQSLFVYGDNTKRFGMAGQAQIRRMPNAIGLATKVAPGGNNEDYFSDLNYEVCCSIIDADIDNIISKSSNYTYIVFPLAGLGTGLSQLPTRAPKVFEYLSKRLEEVFGIATNANGTLDGTFGKQIS